jgi:glycosyltransferase involved in cell wall biosynthesis
VKLSVIVATRNRAHAITGCLDSIAAAFAKAAPLDAEIVVVDNGSTDDTPEIIDAWARANNVPVQTLACDFSGALFCGIGSVRACPLPIKGDALAWR